MPRQLTPHHEALIERIVASGHYSDADQVITEALRQMAERERQRQDLRAKIQIGLDELDRGEGVELTPVAFDGIVKVETEQTTHSRPGVCRARRAP